MPKKVRKQVDGSKARIIVVMVLFALAFSLLWVRAGWVQLRDGEDLRKAALRQSLTAEYEYGRRGRILSRKGVLLATSVEARSVYARPYQVAEAGPETARKLAGILGLSNKKLARLLRSKKKFVWIKRQITDREAESVIEAKLPGVHLTTEYHRLYPNGHLAGQLVGFTGVDGKGLEGFERLFDKRMTPGKARYVVNRDATGRRLYLDANGRETDVDGLDVRLTIDTQVQHAAENALAKTIAKYRAKAGVMVVVDVKKGEVLALANYPFFNPNIYKQTRAAARRNRGVLDVWEPGSTMKPFLIAAALEEGVVEPETLYDCENGRWRVGPKVIRDHHPYKWLTVSRVIRHSSNIGCAKIGRDLGAGPYHEYLTKLGFGRRTGVQLPSERTGILLAAKKWTDVDRAAISFGQGIGVTPLQMARAYLTLANDGVAKPLRLVLSPKVDTGEPPRIFSKETARAVLSMMEDVVHKDGTGRRARINGILMAGKTGTAQKASAKGGYGEGRMSSFVGLVPSVNPEYLIVCMVDEPEKESYGGVVAAPAVRETFIETLAYMGKLPDAARAPETAVAAANATDDVKGNATGAANVTAAAPVVAMVDSKTAVAPAKAGKTVPNVKGMPLRRALELLMKKGVVPQLRGKGMIITRQSPAPGAKWPDNASAKGKKGGENGVFILWLS